MTGMGEYAWGSDPKPIRGFVRLAVGEGLRPSSIENGRLVLLRYSRFLKHRYGKDIDSAGWKEFAAYKVYLSKTGVARSTMSGYLANIDIYYRLKAEATQSAKAFDTYVRTRLIGRVWRRRSEPWKPFNRETLARILQASERSYRHGGRCGEDHVFIMAMLYTGGRAQLYGLRVRDVNFERMEIDIPRKGGKSAMIPLHPRLAEVFRTHLRNRRYDSEFMFRHGHDPETRLGQKANRQMAWRICKRVQEAAGLGESVHPHRFRKTTATEGRRLGLDPQSVQAILGHRYIGMTLDLYATVDREDLKREFARLDFSKAADAPHQGDDGRRLQALMALAPEGKEDAWASVVRGLLGLAGLLQKGSGSEARRGQDNPQGRRRASTISLRSEVEKRPPALASMNRNESLSEYVALSQAWNNGRKC